MKESYDGEHLSLKMTPGEINKIMGTMDSSMPISHYKKIYKRHRHSGLFKKWNSASEFDENVPYNTMELISLAELSHTPLPILLKLGKHRNPEVRLAATTHHRYPQKLKHPIYDEIIVNNGYGDSYILLDALSRPETSADVFNQGVQAMYVGNTFEDMKPSENQKLMKVLYRHLVDVKHFTDETIAIVIASNHSSTIRALSLCPYLPMASSEAVKDYNGAWQKMWDKKCEK